MDSFKSKIFRIICLFLHIYYCYMIFRVWGFKIRTFLFLTKINFFINFVLFAYLNLNSLFQFDKRPEISLEEENPQKTEETFFKQYTRNEMSLIRAGFSFSLTVNFLYWSIILFKPDFMGTGEVPLDVELFLHGGNTVVLLLESFLNKKSLHDNVFFGSFGVLSFAFGYITLKYFVYFNYGIQVYPMISKLSVFWYYCLSFIAYGMYLLSVFVFRRILMVKNKQN